MKTEIDQLFTDEDRQAIRQAVADVESRTAGEIVPVVTPACDDYEGAAWKGAVLGVLGAVAASWTLNAVGGIWGSSLIFWSLLPAFAGAALGFLASTVSTVRRWLVTDETIEARVRAGAESAFLEKEVFATRDRTGVLIFVALFERRVVVLADSGITATVDQSAWDELVERLVVAIREERPAEGLEEAVNECGRILEEHRVDRGPDDRDELSDKLRIEE